jgi:hypothetical protein
MTEDKKRFDTSELPPFPWQLVDGTVYAADGQILLVVMAPVGGEVVDAMNMLAEDGWFTPISEHMQEAYNAYVRADTRNQTALTQIEKYRKDGVIETGSPGIDLQTPAEMLDVLHDVLSGGGSMTYFPCQYAVIPNIGDEGMCVAHATAEFDGKRYCQPHAKALEEKWGASL